MSLAKVLKIIFLIIFKRKEVRIRTRITITTDLGVKEIVSPMEKRLFRRSMILFIKFIIHGEVNTKNKTHPRQRMGKNCYEKEKYN